MVTLSGVHNSVYLYGDGAKRKEAFEFRGDFEWMAPEIMSQARPSR